MKSLSLFFKNTFTNKYTYRWLACFLSMFAIIYYAIAYVNSGVYYDQAVSFRPLCIAFGIFILALMPPKSYLNFFTLAYVPVCYIFMHFAYLGQWIHDDCEYQYPDVLRLGKAVALVWGIVLISIIYDFFKNKRFGELKKGRPFNIFLLCLFLVLMVSLGITCGEYYNAWFIIIAFVSLIYVMRDEKNRSTFLSALEIAMLFSFFFILYKSLRHRPYDTERYRSFFANSNTAGMYHAMALAVFYSRLSFWWEKRRASKDKKSLILLIFWFLMFGIAAEYVVFNYTRTTIMGLLFSFAVLFVIHLIKKEDKKSLFGRAGLIILTVVLMFYPVFLLIRYVPAYINEPTYICWEYDPEVRIVIGDPVDSPKYTSIESFLTLALGKWGIYVDFEDKEDKGIEIDTERDVTNGRVEIWREYISRLSAHGHFPGDIVAKDGEFIYHAHNTFLQFAYQYGLFTGIIYFLTNGFSFLCILLTAFVYAKDKDTERDRRIYFLIFMMGVCLLSQMTECMIHPAYIICFLLYSSMALIIPESYELKKLFTKKKNGEE